MIMDPFGLEDHKNNNNNKYNNSKNINYGRKTSGLEFVLDQILFKLSESVLDEFSPSKSGIKLC